jgi:hypothetical protein
MVAVLVALSALVLPGVAPARRQPSLVQAVVTITPQAPAIAVPQSFFGLSTEYWELPRNERRLSIFERVLALLHARGNGPLILRIGGDSADHTYWGTKTRKLPPRAFKLTPRWFSRTGTLVRRAGLRLILDLNLVANSPPMAVQVARAAQADLPHGSIIGFEIGNEPDDYHRGLWYRLVSIARTSLAHSVLSGNYSARSYVDNFRSYARALARVGSSVPLVGPAVAHPDRNVDWFSRLIAHGHGALGIASAHRYPLSACVNRTSSRYPTVTRLLGENASAGPARTVAAAVRLAHRARLPFRLTELNSVTCGGRRGVSDTFATALWAPDALFELLRAGVDGVNVHVREDTINAPFTLTKRGLQARPLLYGLILFAQTLGRDGHLVRLRMHAPPGAHLEVWAVQVAGGAWRVLVLDKGKRAARIDLHLPAGGPATVERLLAPSAAARSGVTLGGQWLGRDGSWQGHRVVQTITPGARGYELTMPPLSAALISLRARAVTLTELRLQLLSLLSAAVRRTFEARPTG